MADSSRAEQAIEVLEASGFVEVAQPVKPMTTPKWIELACLEYSLDRRLVNWYDTLHGVGAGGGSSASSAWATAYVAARNKRELMLALELDIVSPSNTLNYVDVDELDGWLVEKAVCSLGVFNEKKALMYKYGQRYRDEFIRTKLGLRGRELNIVIGRARTNLQQVLAKLNHPAKIRHYNLNAGNPCPRRKVAP